ncbi:SPASM domain-containing protein [candidate division KSB1 bacterium]|nr:SPASM domain-containing protein [candidate division KSB1 bacterium]
MSTYQITTDLFTLTGASGRPILYAPLTGFACEANPALVQLLAILQDHSDAAFSAEEAKILDYLAQKGVLNSASLKQPQLTPVNDFAPDSLTLFATNRCNLRCVYCYAAADQDHALTMPWRTARSAIDFQIASMLKTGQSDFILEFHGGGEPFCAFSLMQKSAAHAREQCRRHGFTLQVTAASNGVLNEKKLSWAMQNCRALTISFEGLPRIQNRQRPHAGGKASFPMVDRALRTLDRHHFPYAIRTTVTEQNQDLLEETLQFIHQNYACRTWVIEPVQICSSAVLSEIKPADMLKFADRYIHLETSARALGIILKYSGAQLEQLNSAFCHVGRNEFAVTPDGYLTNCWEVSSAGHPYAGHFIFGHILSDGRVYVEMDKWAALRALTVDHLGYCRDCFAKYHCGGGCSLRMGRARGTSGADKDFCASTRQIMLSKIESMLHHN